MQQSRPASAEGRGETKTPVVPRIARVLQRYVLGSSQMRRPSFDTARSINRVLLSFRPEKSRFSLLCLSCVPERERIAPVGRGNSRCPQAQSSANVSENRKHHGPLRDMRQKLQRSYPYIEYKASTAPRKRRCCPQTSSSRPQAPNIHFACCWSGNATSRRRHRCDNLNFKQTILGSSTSSVNLFFFASQTLKLNTNYGI